MNPRFGVALAAAFLALCGAGPAAGGERSKSEVLDSIKARYPALRTLLAAKKVGETFNGAIEAVKSDYLQDEVETQGKTITVEQFIRAENADRTEYFAIAARETKTTPEVVARNFAQVRLSKLKTGEFWKGEDGKWVQKK